MATVRMIDIAVNFTDSMFKGIYNGKQYHMGDIQAVLKRAWSAGVERIIVTGGSLEESKEALAIAETDARLFCTVGVHPTRCKEFEDSGDPEKHLQDLLTLAKEGKEKGKVVAIGECGLDYDRLHFCPSDIQKKYFEKQFELAYTMKLPMFLHMRAASQDFCYILQRNKDRVTSSEETHWQGKICLITLIMTLKRTLSDVKRSIRFGPASGLKFVAGVAHSFTGSAVDCDRLLSFSNKLSCSCVFHEILKLLDPDLLKSVYVSLFEQLILGINGCSLKTAENLEVVKGIPVERMMIETDSPYCDIKNTHAGIRYVKSSWPSKKKDKHDQECLVKGRNEPCLVRQVLEVVAGTKGIADIDQLSQTLYHNTCRVFFPHDLDSAAEALLASGREDL
ncbi:hypothetical protein H5410_029833 [Solanum commersonii]|uniref:Uncharacterized protein n=1 Tax=Solanum commersonii TaxID=4109 RepID=A0A9J5YF68_SOLCO|nr:hypothetical protein H5410_029833 [Solanum commersonii]